MLSHSGLPKKLWGEASLSARFLLNRLPTSANPDFITPFEMMYGSPPDISKIRVWGSVCYAFESDNPALADRAVKCRLVGFVGEDIHAYRLLNCSTGKLLTRYNVIFDESSVINSTTSGDYSGIDFTKSSPVDGSLSILGSLYDDEIDDTSGQSNAPQDVDPSTANLPMNTSSPPSSPRRSGKPTAPINPLNYDKLGGNIVQHDIDDILHIIGSCFNVTSDVFEPSTYEEAISCPDSDKWIAAMGEEYQALVNNGTWERVAAPTGEPVMKCRWVYKVKRNELGEVTRYKARLVAKGFTQQHGVNFFETFSPVAKIQTIRLLFFLSVQFACSITQFDIPNAYVKAPVDEDLYMEHPQGFEANDNSILKLIMALYGTKQAGRCWFKHLTSLLISLDFKQCNNEPCLFYKFSTDGVFVMLALYVDDVLVISPNKSLVDATVKQVEEHLSISILGFPK
jgi:hypothetical protein